MEIIILLVVATGLVYLLVKTSNKPQKKSKAQKQEEIKEAYKRKLTSELSGIKNREVLVEKKTKLLHIYASELSRNLFFTKEEARALLQELAST